MIFWDSFLRKLGYNYRSEVFLQDHFFGGATGSGSVGELGWSTAGTITRPSSTANAVGVVRIDTGAVSGTQSRINFAQNSVVFDPSLPFNLVWRVLPNSSDTDTLYRIGMNNMVQADPTTHGIYFEKLAADANWFLITRNTSVQTRTDSGVAVSTSAFITFRINRASDGVRFYINGTQVGAVQSANIPTTFINPVVSVLNSAAASKTADIDYFELKANGLVLI